MFFYCYSLQMVSRVKPNVFLAVPITSDNIKENLGKLQQEYLAKDERLKEFVVPIEVAHLTLVVFHVKEERLEECKRVLRKVFNDYFLGHDMKNIVFKGLGKFGSKVIFARPVSSLTELNDLNETFSKELIEYGFDVCGDGFNPHLTIFKGKRQRGRQEKKTKQKIILDNFSEMGDFDFGEQEVRCIQFLSMEKEKDEHGYYFCEDTFNI